MKKIYASVFCALFSIKVLAITTEPMFFFNSSEPGPYGSQAKSSDEIFALVSTLKGRNMGEYSACVAQVSALPKGQTGYCSATPVVNIEADANGGYNITAGSPARFIGHTIWYQYAKNSDGSTWSNTQNDVNNVFVTINEACSQGFALNGKAESLTYSHWCENYVDPVPHQCTLSGNPINYLSGDKIQFETDFNGRNDLQVNRRYVNQRQGWVIDSISRLTDLTGRFSNSGFKKNEQNCSAYSSSLKLLNPNTATPDPNDYIETIVPYCLNYINSPNSSHSVILQAADGLHWEFYNKGTYYEADLNSSHLFAIAPETNNGSAWLLQYADNKKEYFDKNGLLIKSVATNNDEITYTYNNDSLITKTNRLGDVLTYHYDTSGRIDSIQIPGGKSVHYAYQNPAGTVGISLLASVTLLDGSTVNYEYNDSRFPYALTGIVDANNVRYASWTYDTEGRAISSQHTNGADLFLFDYSNLVGSSPSVTVTNPLQKKTTYSFQITNGKRLITRVDGVASPNCGAASKLNEYYPNGDLQSKTDWNGNKTTYVYNNAHQEISRTEAFGTPQARTITTEWHPTLNLKTKITEPNKETTYTYDTNGLLTQQNSRALP